MKIGFDYPSLRPSGLLCPHSEGESKTMIDVMVNAVQQPAVPLIVLCLAGLAVVGEALRVSREALWSDLFDDELR